ncbi:MAG: hypothetical protein CMH69_05325 [Nitratireductor sp.]|nr:hypothetical protein [Nitratireductor sp.]
MYDWNDLKYLLAVIRAGSTAAAARLLGVSQTTVARRLDALEHALSAPLFERMPEGFRPTQLAMELLPLAERIEERASRLSDLARAHARHSRQVLRISTTPLLAAYLLPDLLAHYRQKVSEITIEIDTSDSPADLVHGEADLALRLGTLPQNPEIIRSRVGISHWTLYASRDFVSVHGLPTSPEALIACPLAVGEGALARILPLQRLSELLSTHAPAYRCDNLEALIALVRAGLAAAPLPVWLANRDQTLVPLPVTTCNVAAPIWMLSHERNRHVPHIVAFRKVATHRLRTMRHQNADPENASDQAASSLGLTGPAATGNPS